MKMCSKQQFDKKSAKSVLNHCKKEHRKECRIYRCPNEECNGAYHLTSEETFEEKIYLKLEDLIFKDRWIQLM